MNIITCSCGTTVWAVVGTSSTTVGTSSAVGTVTSVGVINHLTHREPTGVSLEYNDSSSCISSSLPASEGPINRSPSFNWIIPCLARSFPSSFCNLFILLLVESVVRHDETVRFSLLVNHYSRFASFELVLAISSIKL